MTREEMSKFVFQTFLLMSEAFSNSTGNREMANEMIKFAEHFGVKTGVIRMKTDKQSKAGNDEIKPFELKI